MHVISYSGQTVSAGISQVFNTSSATEWFSFVGSSGEPFLALGSASEVVLYGWRGVFAQIDSVSANGVAGFTAFTPAAGKDILVVANGGTEGNREIVSHVYRLTAAQELTLVRQRKSHLYYSYSCS